jgi:flavin-dependent dehydrogenase
VRRHVAPAFAVEEVPTRVAYPREAGPHPDALVLRFFAGVAGYLWDFPRPDHRSVGIEVSGGGWQRPELDARVDEYRIAPSRESPSMPESAAEPPRAGAVIGTAQLGHGDFSMLAGDRFALLGDAAGLADPFTGEGIRNALRSATLLAEAWDTGRHDWPRSYPYLVRRTLATELAVSRALRWLLSEKGLGVRLVERALCSPSAYAFVATTLNTVAVHDYAPGRLWSLWREALRDVTQTRSASADA